VVVVDVVVGGVWVVDEVVGEVESIESNINKLHDHCRIQFA